MRAMKQKLCHGCYGCHGCQADFDPSEEEAIPIAVAEKAAEGDPFEAKEAEAEAKIESQAGWTGALLCFFALLSSSN